VAPGPECGLKTQEEDADARDPIEAVRRTERHVHGARIRRVHLTVLVFGNCFARVIYVPLTLRTHPMRILFLALDVDLSKHRGDTIHAVELARALSLLGHELQLVVGADGSARALLPNEVDVQVARGADLSVFAGIRAFLRKRPADVVYERRFSPKMGFAVASFSQLPLVLEVNGILRDELAFQRGHSRKPSAIKARLRKTMMQKVDRFVAVSPSIAQDLVRTYDLDASRVRVIGNGVTTERFRPMLKAEACARLGYPSEAPRVVFVGNLAGWRDFEAPLNAIVRLKAEFPTLELLIVGAGPEEDAVRSAVRSLGVDGVRFSGEVPYSDVPLYIASGDVCLVPERPRDVEISPLKLFEYLACGRPVIASRVVGMDVVESQRVGRLFMPGDPDDLAKTLADMLNDPAGRALMGSQGRSYVERERSWTSVAAKVLQVLGEVVAPAS